MEFRQSSITSYPTQTPHGKTTLKTILHPNHQILKDDVTDGTYLMVAHVPVGPFSKCHDFPHYNAEAPNIACRREFPVCNGLGRSPADGDFSSLTEEKH